MQVEMKKDQSNPSPQRYDSTRITSNWPFLPDVQSAEKIANPTTAPLQCFPARLCSTLRPKVSQRNGCASARSKHRGISHAIEQGCHPIRLTAEPTVGTILSKPDDQ